MVMKTARKLTRNATRTATGLASSVAGRVVSDMTARVTKQVASTMVGKVAEKIASARYPETGSRPKVEVRKIVMMVEEIQHEGGPVAKRPMKKGAIAAVIHNPFAGRYAKDVQHMMELLKPLGYDLADRLIKALGGPKKIEGYGKGGIVGVNGESEHGALWHVPGGYGMRELLEQSNAIVPSTFKVAPAGTVIDIPIHHKTAAYVRSHFDTIEVRVPDAPRPDEIVFVLAMSTGARIHERMGGLKAGEISKFDGQR